MINDKHTHRNAHGMKDRNPKLKYRHAKLKDRNAHAKLYHIYWFLPGMMHNAAKG